jgi:hypothetical protein
LGEIWAKFWKILGTFWENFGIILGKFWEKFGIILGKFWDNFGKILGNFFLQLFGKLEFSPTFDAFFKNFVANTSRA